MTTNGGYQEKFYQLVDDSIKSLSERISVLSERVEELRLADVYQGDRLDSLEKSLLSVQRAVSELRETLYLEIKPSITKLNVKSGIWSVVAGAVPPAIAALYFLIRWLQSSGGTP